MVDKRDTPMTDKICGVPIGTQYVSNCLVLRICGLAPNHAGPHSHRPVSQRRPAQKHSTDAR